MWALLLAMGTSTLHWFCYPCRPSPSPQWKCTVGRDKKSNFTILSFPVSTVLHQIVFCTASTNLGIIFARDRRGYRNRKWCRKTFCSKKSKTLYLANKYAIVQLMSFALEYFDFKTLFFSYISATGKTNYLYKNIYSGITFAYASTPKRFLTEGQQMT